MLCISRCKRFFRIDHRAITLPIRRQLTQSGNDRPRAVDGRCMHPAPNRRQSETKIAPKSTAKVRLCIAVNLSGDSPLTASPVNLIAGKPYQAEKGNTGPNLSGDLQQSTESSGTATECTEPCTSAQMATCAIHLTQSTTS